MVFCVVSAGQELPTTASVPELSKNPRKFNGLFIQVRAWLIFGWEGDNFLFDSAKPAPSKTADFRARPCGSIANPTDRVKLAIQPNSVSPLF
jgi:hypothetical protein